jgi:hypothetical protein
MFGKPCFRTFQNFPNLNFQTFSEKFREFKNSVFFWKISKLQQLNISETREKEKFGKFRLTQGLTSDINNALKSRLAIWDIISSH